MCFNWHVDLDRSLQQKTKIAAWEKNMEVREYISDLLRKELKESKKKERKT
jgi:hypothetical protein